MNEEYEMALSNGDKAICAQIAGEVVEKVLEAHIKACPHGIKLRIDKAYIIGICIGSGLAGGSIGAAVTQLIERIWT